ncbi:hypothetical protein [Nocardia transvalensis]|uniref:hypothetical protein n=1 Tax=Nocardia transvalensis TaxID=37333 RepID=UPI0018947F9C|nr:hypothetical protein [Nocardia transvalensis]MBF6328414.1 hypothetical protein [Nocardia transvalensis]
MGTPSPRVLAAWSHLTVRVTLSLLMIGFGMVKVVPAQFVTFTLPGRMLVTVGESTSAGMLWKFMAASTAYTIISSAVEVLGGILLIFRRTVLLGALVSMAAVVQVSVLNISYGVPVVLVPLLMLVMALVVSAPWWKRLAEVLIRETDSPRRRPVELVTDRRIRLLGSASHLVCAVLVTVAIGATAMNSYHDNTRRLSSWDGVWAVTVFDGPGPLWTHLAIDDRPASTRLVLRRGTELLERDLRIDHGSALLLAAGATLTVTQNAPDALRLSGEFDGAAVRAELHRLPALPRSADFR